MSRYGCEAAVSSSTRRCFETTTIDADVLSELTDGDLETVPDVRRASQAPSKGRGLARWRHRSRISSHRRQRIPCRARRRSGASPAHRLFSDLVGSTALSARLDPEDMRQVIRAYQDAVSGMVARYDGFVAKFMGDGVLAYFGFPRRT